MSQAASASDATVVFNPNFGGVGVPMPPVPPASLAGALGVSSSAFPVVLMIGAGAVLLFILLRKK